MEALRAGITESASADLHELREEFIPPKIAVADCVRHLKGASAYAINHMDGSDGKFKWQEGYGALTVSENSLDAVMQYAAKQKEHHCENKLVAVYERIEED